MMIKFFRSGLQADMQPERRIKMVVLNVHYFTKPGKRAEFYEAVNKLEVPQKSRAEEGNIKYDYYMSIDNEDEILLVENWKDEAAFRFHTEQAHFKALGELKAEYVEETVLKRYEG
jgi:quinol monooxygenase YgiN